jgi:hypothetical protein
MSSKIALVVGFADLSGADFASFLSEDIVSALFETTNIAAARRIPAAEILFLYARFEANGALEGTPAVGVRQIAQEVRSSILVVASPISGGTIENAMGFPGPKTANLVSRSTAKGLRSPVFSVPSLRECVTVKTCFKRGSSFRRWRRWKRMKIMNLCFCPRAAQLPSRASSRTGVNDLQAFAASVLQNFRKE